VPRAVQTLPAWAKLAAVAAVAIAAGTVVAVVTRPSTAGSGPVRELLPDLLQRAPYSLAGETAVVGGRRRFRLGFASAVDNVGAGPLDLVARRPRTVRRMTADQVVHRSDESTSLRRRVGTLAYTRSTGHQHWHLLGFERYWLRALGRPGIRRDAKTGFCLGDRYDSNPIDRRPAEPSDPVFTRECGRNGPGLLRMREGISVGHGDDYDPLLEGQYVDVTGLPAGRYELVHEVNRARALRELDYRNNAASIVLRLSWPSGTAANPSVDVLERCGSGRRCTSR
jgi:hypothetical protein